MRPALVCALVLLAAAAACGGARAADPSALAATSGAAAALHERRPPIASVRLTPKEAAKAAAAAARARTAPLRSSAWPAPHYDNYSLAASRDTFEICKNQSGVRREMALEDLPALYGLPRDLLRHRRVPVATLMRVISDAAPSVRLVIAPLLAGEAELSPVLHPDGRLPRLVHFTVRDKDALLPHQALAIATWAVLNPGYAILLYDDDDIADFMALYHGRLLPLFRRLGSQVERTDLWRYLVLCTFGGVYADSDVVAGRPVSGWAQDAGLLTGVENVFETMDAARRRDYTRVMQVVQWTIAARPGHPVVCRMGDYIQRRLDAEASGAVREEDRDHAILERTGPGIWSSSVHDYLREQGVAPESVVGGARVGDVRLLPQSSFGCASSTVNLADPMAYVYHMFKGSWRLNEHEKLWQFVAHLYAHLFSPHTAAEAVGTSPAIAAGRKAALNKGAVQVSPAVGAEGAAAAKEKREDEGRLAAPSSGKRAPQALERPVDKQQRIPAGQDPKVGINGGWQQQQAPGIVGSREASKRGQRRQQQQQQQQQSQQEHQLPKQRDGKLRRRQQLGSAPLAGNDQAVERRLHEQEAPLRTVTDGAAMVGLQPLEAQMPLGVPHTAHSRGVGLLPVLSLLAAAVLVASTLVQRSSTKCGGRPCGGGGGGLRHSASGALAGIWGGATRLASSSRAGGLASSSSAASLLLPLSQAPPRSPSTPPLPLGAAAAAGASTATRSPVGVATGGCLKRSSGSMQCLHSAGMQ